MPSDPDKLLTLVLAGFLLVTSCSSQAGVGDVEPLQMEKVTVPSTGEVGMPVEIQLQGFLPADCWVFDSLSIQRGNSKNQYVVRAFKKQVVEMCEETASDLNLAISFVPTSKGQYEVIEPDIPATWSVNVGPAPLLRPTANASATALK